MTVLALPWQVTAAKYAVLLLVILVVVPALIRCLERDEPLRIKATDDIGGACAIKLPPPEECRERFFGVLRELARDFGRHVRMLLMPTFTIMLLASVVSARETDAWKWRQIRLTPVLPGKPAAEQLANLPKGDEVASARELVVFLALHALTTSERPEVGGRCRDVLPSGRRVIVSFGPFGFSLGSMAESWGSPAFGLAAVFTPRK